MKANDGGHVSSGKCGSKRQANGELVKEATRKSARAPLGTRREYVLRSRRQTRRGDRIEQARAHSSRLIARARSSSRPKRATFAKVLNIKTALKNKTKNALMTTLITRKNVLKAQKRS